MNLTDVQLLNAVDFRRRLDAADATQIIEDVIRQGLDPAADTPRSTVHLRCGHALLMPSEGAAHIGLKVAMVAEGSAAKGTPRIQATYLMFDARTLALTAILDGSELTKLRTAAVSMAAIRPALPRIGAEANVVVFGSGSQAQAHLDALELTLPHGIGTLTAVVRDISAGEKRLRDHNPRCVAFGSADLEAALRAAHIVITATTAREPLFGALQLGEDPIVVAVGSHEPGARELPPDLLSKSRVVVEDLETSLREAGDIILAIDDGALVPADISGMAELITSRAVVDDGRPYVFKSTGMAWEDLAVADAALAMNVRGPK